MIQQEFCFIYVQNIVVLDLTVEAVDSWRLELILL